MSRDVVNCTGCAISESCWYRQKVIPGRSKVRRRRRSSFLRNSHADHFSTAFPSLTLPSFGFFAFLSIVSHSTFLNHKMSVAASRSAARLIQRSLRSTVSTSSPLRSAIPQSSRQSSRLSVASSTIFPSRRPFSSSSSLLHAHLDPPKPGEERKVTFIDKDGDEYTYEVADGDNLLDIGVSLDTIPRDLSSD